MALIPASISSFLTSTIRISVSNSVWGLPGIQEPELGFSICGTLVQNATKEPQAIQAKQLVLSIGDATSSSLCGRHRPSPHFQTEWGEIVLLESHCHSQVCGPKPRTRFRRNPH